MPYQSVTTPSGIIANFFGPLEGEGYLFASIAILAILS